MTSQLPTRVTRFYGGVDFAMQVIRDKHIAFVPVTFLNDPFDPYCFFETDFGEAYGNLLNHVKAHHPNDLGWFRTHVPPKSWLTTVRALNDYLVHLRTHASILATSAPTAELHPKDNLYMWGHYGNGHRGIAIEFDTASLAAAVVKQHERENGSTFTDGAVWTPVEYANSFAPIAVDDVFQFMKRQKDVMLGRAQGDSDTALSRYYQRMSAIKGNVWRSENEWRLMWRTDAEATEVYKCPITADCIASIFIGLNFQGDGAALVAHAKSEFAAAEIYRATKRHGDFALDYRRL